VKLRFIHLFVLPCLFLVLPAVSRTAYAQSATAITENKVIAIMEAIDQASRKGNIAGIVAPLARDAKIKMTITAPNGSQEQVVNLTKDQYTMLTRRTLRSRVSYQVQRKNTRVKIYEGGDTAMSTSDLYETLTMPQGTLRAVSTEVSILSVRNGRILITSVEAKTRLY